MKKTLLIVLTSSFFIGMIALGLYHPVHAQNISTPENMSIDTVWNPVALNSNYLTDYYFPQGNTTVFHGTISNYGSQPQRVLLTAEIYTEEHRRVGEVVFDNVGLNPMEHFNFEFISPRSLSPGQYYYAVGVYQEGTQNLIGWYPGYQHFTVAQ